MALVAPLLAAKVALAIAAGAGRLARPVLRLEALHRSPRLDLRAVNREVLVRQQFTYLLVVKQLSQELARHIRLEQSVAVLREHTRHPYRLVHPKPHEPTIEQIVVELLHQLTLRADRIERLQQQRPQQPLRSNRGATRFGVLVRKILAQGQKHIVHHRTNHPQRMLRWHPVLKIYIREQITRPRVRTPHQNLPCSPHSTESYSLLLVRSRIFQQPARQRKGSKRREISLIGAFAVCSGTAAGSRPSAVFG